MRVFCYLVALVFSTLCFSCQQGPAPYIQIQGETMGTTYNVAYSDPQERNFKPEIDELLRRLNLEVSTYIETSTISQFNQADSTFSLQYDPESQSVGGYENLHFLANYRKAREVYERTDGYFDPTVMPLVNYWGFGYAPRKKVEAVDSVIVDSLLQFIGMDKVELVSTENGYLLRKARPGVQLDFSALAKGYGVDIAARLLADKGVNNFMVEIGGEVAAEGVNPRGEAWKIGINVPREAAALNDIQAAVPLQGQALATSGNYRNFYEVDGRKYSHTINPKTGFPERTPLLSASVFAPDCMTADAYATAFMALGLKRAFELAGQLTEVEAYFIYNMGESLLGTRYTEGLAPVFEDEDNN